MENISPKIALKLFQIELALEKKVISDIRERQKRVAGLKQDPLRYTACWGDRDLTAGCRDCCLGGRWAQIRTTTRCNLNCKFCYYYGKEESHIRERIPKGLYRLGNVPRFYDERDMKLFFEVQGKKHISGVAWCSHEPLMEMSKIPSLMEFLSKKGYYQWLVTNGVLATRENLKKLSDAGLDEIRFDLAATNCSLEVIKNMKIARKYFKSLCIESPMFTDYFNSFLKRKREILDTGVNQIMIHELQLFPNQYFNFKNEGPIYRHKGEYISPIKSRQLTYDIFDIAAREGWKNVLLHDCSNEVKFYRGVNADNQGKTFGALDYLGHMKLPDSFFEEVLKRDDLAWD